ncbi:MAG TPA: hypothetical protein VK619_06310 [Pyrinomonadaceae bacterium]|nr:hypothetical protein [Pyrinomonadaceae bacterium]
MRNKASLLYCLLALLALTAGSTNAQTKEFTVKKLKQYWTDNSGRPWNDLSYQMAVRIDPQYASSLGTDEISTDSPPLKYVTGEWHFFSLQRDAQGTFAEVDYLVYKDSNDPVTYQVELQKNGKAAPFASGSSKVVVSNDTASLPRIPISQPNPILMKDWLLIIGVMLAGAALIYVLIFRWLFTGLLNRRMAVVSAEHFTWSLSLLALLGLATALLLFALGPRLETWLIMGVTGAFWLLHGVVWLVSGKEA